MAVSCCRYCEERELGCHSKCEKYITAKAEHDRINEEMRKARMLDSIERETKARLYWRKMRHKR